MNEPINLGTISTTADKPLKRRGNPNWVKGVSGNPSGMLNKPISTLARMHTKKAVDTLVHIMEKGQQEGARVSAAQAVLDRGWGKAPTFTTSNADEFKKAVDLTDDELAAIAATHLKLVVNNS